MGPLAVPEEVEKKEEKADAVPKMAGEDSQTEKPSEPEKDVKSKCLPDQSLSKKETEEVCKQEHATISEKATDLKEEKSESAPQKSSEDSQKAAVSAAEKDVKLDTAPVPAERQEKSKEDAVKDKQVPASVQEKVAEKK